MTTVLEEAVARAFLPAPQERRRLRVEVARQSQRRLARELEVSAQAVCFWEAGKRTPRGDNLLRYVDLLAQLRRLESL